METSVYKKSLLLTIVVFVFLLAQPFTWAQKPSTIKSNDLKKPGIQQKAPITKGLTKAAKAPDVQVVNNSGENIYQAKVGSMIFSSHIGACSDGCSTGFKKIKRGSNKIFVKVSPVSPWVEIGTLSGFNYNKHYAVNIVTGRGGVVCAELWLHHDTSTPFNENRVKEKTGNVCSRFTPLRPAD